MKKAAEILDDMGSPRLKNVPNPYAGGVFTKHGWFSQDDLVQAQAKVLPVSGTVLFPIGYRNVGFDQQTGKVIQEPIYPPEGIENSQARREIAEHDGHTFESRVERYKQARKDFERDRNSYGPRRGA